jgi:hypothetical protein
VFGIQCQVCDILPAPKTSFGVGFSPTPAIASDAMSFVLDPRDAPPQIIKFLPLYPTSFTVLDDVVAAFPPSHGGKLCGNDLFALSDKPTGHLYYFKDVPTSFQTMQRSRLPEVAMHLGRGLSDILWVKLPINNYTTKPMPSLDPVRNSSSHQAK